MIKNIIILILTLSLNDLISGQSLAGFLEQVSDNNPEIQAHSKLLEARRIEARTGLTPSDPFISAGFMPGSNDGSGNKKTWSVTQSFDFPTKYLLQRKINKNTILLAEQEFNHGRILILLESEMALFDLIYNTKTLYKLKERKTGYDSLRSGWEKMLDNGETTILDYNKIMFELSAVNLEITKKEAEIEMLNEKLRFMSGSDVPLKLPDEYPVVTLPDIDKLLKEKSEVHPAFLIPEIEYNINTQELRLSKAGSLPGFQVGYASEILPGESYTGPVAGMTIPLWANSNRIKSASAMAEHSSALRDAMLFRLRSEILIEFANMKALQKSISEIRIILDSGGGTKYPDIALINGEISVNTYFMYMDAYYKAEDRLMELENEYYKSLAVLLDYKLIK
ncbi:MAG: TolC family protein [Bacteroidales bacterium]|nr:TolC family protein [Bacteroidales bacterium]